MRSAVTLSLVLLAGTATACAPTLSSSMYNEPAVDRSEISIGSVAIVPNRLPLNLQDPEKWRRSNWQIIRNQFARNRIRTVDYQTSKAVFERSGLPIEDAPGSRDKYAALAEELGVDAIVVPYYGTFAYAAGNLLLQEYHFVSVTTLQIYVPDQATFVARIDASGDDGYTAYGGAASLGSVLAAFNPAIAPLTTLLVLGAFGHDLYQAFRTPETRWETAFEASLQRALRPFFTQYVR